MTTMLQHVKFVKVNWSLTMRDIAYSMQYTIVCQSVVNNDTAVCRC